MNDNSMKGLRTVILVALAIAVTAVGFMIIKSTQEVKAVKEVEAVFKGVRVRTVKLEENFAKVKFSGKLRADKKVELFSEVNGVLLSDNFREGISFRKGAVIVQLDASEISNTLKAQKSNLLTQVAAAMGDIKIDYPKEGDNWEAFLNDINVNKALPNLPVIEDQKLKRFIAGKGLLNTYYSIKSQEEKLAKYSLKAPFNGEVVMANVKKGTLVRGGQKLGEFINPAVYELETEVSLSDLEYVKPGYSMQLHSDDLRRDWVGKVTRVNSSIDVNSQMVKVYVVVQGASLKEGMYLYGSAEGTVFKKSFTLNRKLVNNGCVYVVVDGLLVHKKVTVLYVNQATSIVEGLDENDQIVADNMKGLFEGMKVNVIK